MFPILYDVSDYGGEEKRTNNVSYELSGTLPNLCQSLQHTNH